MSENTRPPVLIHRTAELHVKMLALIHISPLMLRRFKRHLLISKLDSIEWDLTKQKARFVCNNPIIRYPRKISKLGWFRGVKYAIRHILSDVFTPSRWKYYLLPYVMFMTYTLNQKLRYWQNMIEWVEFHYIQMDRSGYRDPKTGQMFYPLNAVMDSNVPLRPNRKIPTNTVKKLS